MWSEKVFFVSFQSNHLLIQTHIQVYWPVPQYNPGRMRPRPMFFFFSTIIPFFSFPETQIWQPASFAQYKQAQMQHKYFTLILNAVSISLNQSSKRDYKILLHQLITISSKQHHKYSLKPNKQRKKKKKISETRTFGWSATNQNVVSSARELLTAEPFPMLFMQYVFKSRK